MYAKLDVVLKNKEQTEIHRNWGKEVKEVVKFNDFYEN
jgi:hypothetical protein